MEGRGERLRRRPGRRPARHGPVDDAYQFIGGLKAHAKAYIALTAPTVNSYKRLVVGSRSGSAWAPVYISYGCNNRTQMLRIPDAGRIEDRTVDGSCNPYLAATAILAAGLDGIERGPRPGRARPPASTSTSSAADERSELGIELLPGEPPRRDAGAGARRRAAQGARTLRREDYVDYFIDVKRGEWRQAHNEITEWELERYLQLF